MKENSLLTKRVGIWIRVSTEDQAKGDSPEIHEARARAYASAKGWHVVELYDLAGVKGWSGKTIREHPYESIGVAFGVGLLIGVLVGRR